MGVDYSISLLSEDPTDETGRITWLDELGLSSYRVPVTGRWPSLNEVRVVAINLRDEFSWVVEEHVSSSRYSVKFDRCIEVQKQEDGSEWHVSTRGGTTLECEGYNGDENTPHQFSFYRGWSDAVVTVAELLSRMCGDFSIISSYDGIIVVSPGTPPNADWWDPYADNEEDGIEVG